MELKRALKFKFFFYVLTISFTVLLVCYIKRDLDAHFTEDEDIILNLNTDKRVKYDKKFKFYGLEYEEHKIKTEDGYILTAWRIFNKNLINKNKSPVLINHGLLECSYTFIVLDDKQSLPFMLANDG